MTSDFIFSRCSSLCKSLGKVTSVSVFQLWNSWRGLFWQDITFSQAVNPVIFSQECFKASHIVPNSLKWFCLIISHIAISWVPLSVNVHELLFFSKSACHDMISQLSLDPPIVKAHMLMLDNASSLQTSW